MLFDPFLQVGGIVVLSKRPPDRYFGNDSLFLFGCRSGFALECRKGDAVPYRQNPNEDHRAGGDELRGALLHVDFYEVNDQKPITIGIPVKLTGLAQGVRDGGRMNLSIRKINVTAKYQEIPEHLDIDVTSLKIGKSIKVGDLHFEGLEMATGKEVVVCSIKATRKSAAASSSDADAE